MIGLDSDIGRMFVAVLLGTVVGLEREISEKPAGLKTNVLICLGSTVFTLYSLKFAGAGMDPSRIAAQIVSGIGFLGAGAIMREGEQVTGLTTAATIWMVAAVGMGVGMGYYTLSAVATFGTLVVQVGLQRLDLLVDQLRRRQVFKVVSDPDERAIEAVGRILKTHSVRVLRRKVMKRDNRYHSEWITAGSPIGQESAVRELLLSERVIEVTY